MMTVLGITEEMFDTVTGDGSQTFYLTSIMHFPDSTCNGVCKKYFNLIHQALSIEYIVCYCYRKGTRFKKREAINMNKKADVKIIWYHGDNDGCM